MEVPLASDRRAWAERLGDQMLDRRLMADLDCLDVLRAIAGGLGTGYGYGVEFIELVDGKSRGLHRSTILSGATLADPVVIRLDHDERAEQLDALLSALGPGSVPVRLARP